MLNRLVFAAALCSLIYAQERGVPVVIDGQEVLRVCGSVGSFNAGERAPEIQRRITAFAKSGYAGEFQTRSMPSENATGVFAGPVVVMAVTQEDADAAGVPRDELAKRYAAAIRKAVETYKVRHTWQSYLAAFTKAALAWCLFFISVWVLRRVIDWLNSHIEQRLRGKAGEASTGGFTRLLLERSQVALMTAVKLAVTVALLSVCSFVLSYSFGLFPQTAGISLTLWEYLRHTFGAAGAAVVGYLPDGGIVALVVLGTHYLLRVIRFLAQAIEHGDLVVKGMHPEMVRPTYQLARLIVVLFALVVAFPYLPGGKSEAFKGVSIFLGLLLSFGSSSSVSNILAGLILTYMRPFRTGDRVKIAETVGDVLEKTLLVTRLQTVKNVEVVIPNAAVLSSQILNYSALARTHGLILHTTVTIGYDAPWRRVHELLTEAALSTEGILHDPAPFVLETSLNDFHISYELNTYTDRANEFQIIYSRLHEAIQDSFNKGGVEIMSPTFYALRDGNTVTIPEEHRPTDYVPPSFRVKDTNGRNASGPKANRAGGRS